MLGYIVRRLLLIVPTLLGIMVLNFALAQWAPGGPVEQMIARLEGNAVGATDKIAGAGSEVMAQHNSSQAGQNAGAAGHYRGAQGLSPEVVAQIEKDFGFDKPVGERFLIMMRNYLRFDFGDSYFQNRPVMKLVLEKLPVSLSLGLWTTLLIYGVSIPLGIAKAVRDGSAFDTWSSIAVAVGYAVPSFLFGVLLIELFAGGSFLQIFPMRGLVSDDFHDLPWYRQALDYAWHMILPITAMVVGGFASLTMLTKNSFIDEIGKQYVLTARAKGLAPGRVLYGHIFRNAMLLVISGIPGAFIGILFGSSVFIEILFSLDGLGLLGYQATIDRDYPIMFGSLYVFTLIGLVMNLVSDLTYVLVDPRIDFETR